MRRIASTAALVMVAGLLLGTVVAQALGPATVNKAEPGFLVDQDGLSLYVYINDAASDSVCYDVCADNWPPLLTDGQPTAGTGVIGSLLGTFERADGTTQVTFAGWPLYHHARDDDPGEVHGHRMGNVFFLMSPAGARVDVAVEPVIAEADTDDDEPAAASLSDEFVILGRDTFATICSACHGNEAQGGVGPTLADSTRVADANNVISTVLNGRPDHGMPPFADQFDDEQVAAVVTFVRTSFGNSYGGVTADEVAARR